MTDKIKIACIGECMVEFAPSANDIYHRNFAGDTFNTAVYFKRQFEEQLEVSYISALGCDSLSSAIINKMQAEGVNTDNVSRLKDGKPGLYLIENDKDGERTFSYWRETSAARSMFKNMNEDDIYTLLAPFDLIYLSGISLAIIDSSQRQNLFAALAKLKSHSTIAFDPNFRPALWQDAIECACVFKEMAKVTNIVLSTFDDDIAIWNDTNVYDAAKRWLLWGASEVVVKNGALGCTIYSDDNRVEILPPKKISPLDTTGAGDSFCAGYLGAKLLGFSETNSAILAHKVAGQVIQHLGGVIDEKSWKRV